MTATRPEAPYSPLQRAVLLMVLLNAFTTPLMLSATNVALPAIAEDLQLDAVLLSWIPMAYLMASAMFVLIFGRIADSAGRKRIFLLGTAAVIVSSSLAALSTSGGMLVAGRFLQGISAAMLYATQMAIVTSVFPASQRGRMIGLVVSSVYVGLSAGPLIGGLVIDTLGWRFSFLLQVPLAIIVLLTGLFRVHEEWRASEPAAFDPRGAVLYSSTILLLCLGVSQLPAWQGGLLLLGSALLLTVFLRHARRAPNPIWDVRLFFSNRTFTFSCGASLIMYSATYANVVLMSLYLQYLRDLSAFQAGMLVMVQPVSMALLSPWVGRWSDSVEPRRLASVGMAVTAAGLVGLALLDESSSMASIIAALLLTGAGFSLFSSPNVNAIMGSVGQPHAGSASAAVATTRLLGQLNSMVLVALMLTLLMGATEVTEQTLPRLDLAITGTFLIAAALCLPGIILSLARGRLHGPARDTEQQTDEGGTSQ